MNRKLINDVARGSLTLAAVIASVLGTAPVRADEEQAARASSSLGIEEIVVTAQRKEEHLQDVPIAISALSADNLVSRGVNALADLKPGAIPGLVVNQFAGTPSVLAVGIRGVGMSDPSQGTVEMTVPVYIDGVFLGRGQGLGLELIDPERVEILRGPQGQLFGRNAEGGVIQYVTRKPTGEFGLKASASYGNYNDERLRLAVDLPKVAGFSTQFSGIMVSHDAYTPQNSRSFYPGGAAPPGPNADYGYLDASGGRAAIRWDNDGSFTADYTYDYTDNEDSQPYLTWLPVDINGRVPFALVPPSDDYPSITAERLYNQPFKTLASGHALTLAWQASDAMTLKSISSYREVSRHGGSDLGTPLVAAGSSTGLIYTFAREDIVQSQWSQELQFIGSWSQFDLTAGAMYYHEDVTDQRRSRLTGPGLTPPALGLNPALGYCIAFLLDPCPGSSSIQEAKSDSLGIYAQGTYRPAALDDRLELTLGLRYTDDKKDAKRTFSNGAAVNQPASFAANRVDPAATIVWKFSDDVNTYLRYATGYRAGGANVRSSNFNSFEEEENEAFELGLKSQFLDNRVQLNVALFHNTIKGEQLTIQEAPAFNPSLTNTFNSPKDKTVDGAEVELVWLPLEGLTTGLNFAYMNVDDYKEYDNPYTPVEDLSRFYAVTTPETSGSVYLTYETQPRSWGSLAFHTDYAYSDDFNATPGAQPVASFGPDYKRPTADSNQLTARLAWRFDEGDNGRLELALWGKNLLDDTAIIYGFDGCASGGGFCAYRTPPRTYGVEVRMDY